MPAILTFSFVLLLALMSADAQPPSETAGPRGFIRCLNAVSNGSGKLDFLIDGRKVRDEGYELGDVTGGIPRKPGSYKIKFKREGVKEGEVNVVIAKNETTVLIPISEWVPTAEKKEGYWKIRILKLTQFEAKEKLTATIVNMTRKPELKVEIRQEDEKWETLTVKQFGLERTAIQKGSGYVPMKTDGAKLKSLSVGTSGNFVTVIFEDAAGELRSQTFQDHKYLGTE